MIHADYAVRRNFCLAFVFHCNTLHFLVSLEMFIFNCAQFFIAIVLYNNSSLSLLKRIPVTGNIQQSQVLLSILSKNGIRDCKNYHKGRYRYSMEILLCKFVGIQMDCQLFLCTICFCQRTLVPALRSLNTVKRF